MRLRAQAQLAGIGRMVIGAIERPGLRNAPFSVHLNVDPKKMPELSFAVIVLILDQSPKLMQTQGLRGHIGPSTNSYPSRGVIILHRVVFSEKRGAVVGDSRRIGLAFHSGYDRSFQSCCRAESVIGYGLQPTPLADHYCWFLFPILTVISDGLGHENQVVELRGLIRQKPSPRLSPLRPPAWPIIVPRKFSP